MFSLLMLLACTGGSKPTPPEEPSPDPVAEPDRLQDPSTDPATDPEPQRPEFFIQVRPEADIPELGERMPASQYNNAGHRYYEKGDLFAAILLFRKAIATDDRHALAHYNLACSLALVRGLQGGTACGDIEAYQDSILRLLERSVALDRDRQARIAEDPDLDSVRHLMRFRIIAGADMNDPDTLHSLLATTRWFDPPQGAFGSLKELDLKDDGTYPLGWTAGGQAAHDGVEAPALPSPGTWELEGFTLRLKHKGDLTILGVNPMGSLLDGQQPVWTEDPAECSA